MANDNQFVNPYAEQEEALEVETVTASEEGFVNPYAEQEAAVPQVKSSDEFDPLAPSFELPDAEIHKTENKGLMSNTVDKIQDRSMDIFGNLLQAGSKLTDTIVEPITETIGDVLINSDGFTYLSPEEVKQQRERGEEFKPLDVAGQFWKGVDTDYIPIHTPESVKKAYATGSPWETTKEVLKYSVEQGFGSIPDMAAVIINLPLYVASRSNEMGEARAKNKGKDKSTAIDMFEAAPFAIGSALLERIGAKGIVDAGKNVADELGKDVLDFALKRTLQRISKEGLKAGGREGLTEFVQEGIIEYSGERLGTDKEMTIAEGAEHGFFGMLAGGPTGTALGGAGAAYRELFDEKDTSTNNSKTVSADELGNIPDSSTPEGGLVEPAEHKSFNKDLLHTVPTAQDTHIAEQQEKLKGVRLPQDFNEPRLKRVDFREQLKSIADEFKDKQKPTKELNPQVDDLLTAIAKSGGISRTEAEEQGIDPEHFRDALKVFGKPVFKSTGGLSFDGMAELLSQHGYTGADYSANGLLDKVSNALSGNKEYSESVDLDLLSQSASHDSIIGETGFTADQVRLAVSKALNGERLGVKQGAVVQAILDQVTDERTSGEFGNLDYAKQELEKARQIRATFSQGVIDNTAEDWLYDEFEYNEELDASGRIIFELLNEARTYGEVAEDAAMRVAERSMSDTMMIVQLSQLIREHKGYDQKDYEQVSGFDSPQAIPGEQSQGAYPETTQPADTGGGEFRPIPATGQPSGPVESQQIEPSNEGFFNADEETLKNEDFAPEVEQDELTGLDDIDSIVEQVLADNSETESKPNNETSGRRRDAERANRTSKGERRKNKSARDLYSELTKEELLDKLLSHELTGIKGRRSFVVEVENADNVFSIDADSLKWFNDNMSPESGDKLLQAIADTLVEEAGHDNSYHISGDEFYVLDTGQGVDKIKEQLAAAQERLADAIIEVTKEDGTKITKTGVQFTFGIGKTRKEADHELKQEKERRQETGERAARGEQPSGVDIQNAEGKPDNKSDSATESDEVKGVPEAALKKEAKAEKPAKEKASPGKKKQTIDEDRLDEIDDILFDDDGEWKPLSEKERDKLLDERDKVGARINAENDKGKKKKGKPDNIIEFEVEVNDETILVKYNDGGFASIGDHVHFEFIGYPTSVTGYKSHYVHKDAVKEAGGAKELAEAVAIKFAKEADKKRAQDEREAKKLGKAKTKEQKVQLGESNSKKAKENLKGLPDAAVKKEKVLTLSFEGQEYPVESFEDASNKYRQVIEKTGVGSRELNEDPEILENGEVIAYVSYNGKVWPDEVWTKESKPLYDPKQKIKGIPEAAIKETSPAKVKKIIKETLSEASVKKSKPTKNKKGKTPKAALKAPAIDEPQLDIFAQPEQNATINKEALNDTSKSKNLESNSAAISNKNPVGKGNVQQGSGRSSKRPGRASKPNGESGSRKQSDKRVSTDSTTTDGESGNFSLFEQDGSIAPSQRVTRTNDSAGSPNTSDQGIQSDTRTDGQVKKSARKSADELKTRIAKQKKASKLPVTLNNKSNIVDTLPVLHVEQLDDVAKAEQRYFVDNKKGMLFTNGTGTGKTYSGLGIAKRFYQRGKKNILVVVPTDKKAKDWIEDGENIDLPITQLDGIKDSGKDAVVTTYANFRDNEELIRREWDVVIYDESHYLLSNQAAKSTAAMNAHHMVTNHPSGIRSKSEYLSENFQSLLKEKANHIARLVKQGMSEDKAKSSIAGEYTQRFHDLKGELSDIAKGINENDQTKALFLSATPFAYVNSTDYAVGYLFDYPAENESTKGGYGHNTSRDEFFIETFGYRKRYGKLTKPDADVNADYMERNFHKRLTESGALSGRKLEIDADYSREFIDVDSELGKQIDEGISALRFSETIKDENGEDVKGEHGNSVHEFELMGEFTRKKFDYHFMNRLLENMKAEAAVERAHKHIELGRKVIVFHSYKQGNIANPFIFPNSNPMESGSEEQWSRELALFNERFPDLNGLDMSSLINPIPQFQRNFGDRLRLFNGDIPKNKRNDFIKEFNKDNSKAEVILIQEEAGKEGISLHDITGVHQRALISLGLPVRPVNAIQIEGRGYRTGSVSDFVIEYMKLGLQFEEFAFASKVAQRSRTAENLAMGFGARDLERAFVDGYMESTSENPSLDQGKGGKESDSRLDESSPFENAKAMYFGIQKKTSKNKSREGSDYFATPEPLGMKMVEWANIKPNEKGLEPSAGHGAIARFFPDYSRNTFVEPSGELQGKLALNAKGNIKAETFEELKSVNKFHGIVMNPPFGSGGSTAVKHLAKAFKHLKNGGRVVALIPEGPSANKKFDKWLFDNKETENAHFIASISLPSVTFERAGTKVKTRIVVIDKQNNKDDAIKLPQQRNIEISGDNIKEFFDNLEDYSMGDRVEPAIPDTDPDNENDLTDADIVPTEEKTNTNPTNAVELTKGTHTKKNIDIWTLTYNERVPRETFLEHKAKAKELGGYYSRWATGFIFEDEASGNKFHDWITGDSPTISEQVTNETRPQSGFSASRVKGIADNLVKGWKIKPNITVVESGVNLPDQYLEAYYTGKAAKAFIDDKSGEVFIVADQIGSEEQVERAVFHEILGHAGLRSMLGNDMDALMDKVWAAFQGTKEMQAIQRSYKGKLNPAVKADRLKLAEELMAKMAEQVNKNTLPQRLKNLWNRIVAFVKDAIRKLGFRPELTKADLTNILMDAANYIRNGGKVTSSEGVSFSTNQSGFYSAMKDVIALKLPNKGTAAQFKQNIEAFQKKGLIKKEELEWSGLMDWLDGMDGKLTQEDVLFYLARNDIEITETMRGGNEQSDYRAAKDNYIDTFVKNGWEWQDASDAVIDAINDSFTEAQINSFAAEQHTAILRLKSAQKAYQNSDSAPTAHSKYQLSGGKNYRELLLKMPPKKSYERMDWERMSEEFKGEIKEKYNVPEYAHALDKMNDSEKAQAEHFNNPPEFNEPDVYKNTGHFPDPNILVHVRFNERKDNDGRRVLFIEEVQSDWHQEGRKKGYRKPDNEKSMLQEIADSFDNERLRNPDGVPDAPFKQSWPLLAMKRMIRFAAENGFSRIAWTNGEQQATRYDLSEQIDRVEYTKTSDGRYSLSLYSFDDETPMTYSGKKAKELSRIVGKEIAEKIEKGEGTTNKLKRKVLSNIDIRVGGEGMKAFYDERLPAAVNKYVKKWGAKVGTTEFDFTSDGETESSYSIDAEDIGADLDFVQNVQVIRSSDMSIVENFNTIYDAEKWIDKNETSITTHALDIPERMRDSVNDLGQPLFMVEDEQDQDRDLNRTSFTDRKWYKRSQKWIEEYTPFKDSKFSNVGIWSKTVGSMYHLGQKEPSFKKVFDSGQAFLNDVSRIAVEAEGKAQSLFYRMDTVKQAVMQFATPKKAGIASDEDTAAVAIPVYRGTIIDEKVYDDNELVDRFGLNETQIRLYHQVIAATQKSLDDTTMASLFRTAKTMGVDSNVLHAARRISKDAKEFLEMVYQHSLKPVRGQLKAELEELQASIDDAPDLLKTEYQAQYDSKKAEFDTVERDIAALYKMQARANQLKKEGYFPLMRFGEHYIDVSYFNEATGKTEREAFLMYENAVDASEALEELTQEYPDAEINHGKISQEQYKLFQGLSPDTIELFARQTGMDQSEAFQDYIKLAVSNRSAMKRLIKRKKTPGFSKDLSRTLANFIMQNSRLAASHYHMGDMVQAIDNIPGHKGDVKDMAVGLRDYLINPTEEFSKIRNFMFFHFLGGSISSALVNLTQVPMATFPYLSQWGATQAGKMITKWAKPGAKPIDNKHAQDLLRAEEEGIVSPQEVYNLMATARGQQIPILKGKKTQAFLFMWGSMFSAAEQYNRRVSFNAAYEIARNLGESNPYEFAVKAVDETQFIYNRGNRPRLARGIGAPIFTFKQFMINYLEMLTRLPKKQQALAIALIILAAGVEGLPFAEDAEDILDTIMQWAGYNWNTRAKMIEWAKDIFGKEAGEMIAEASMRGVTSVIPLDIQGRLSFGNIIPGTSALKPSETQKGSEAWEVLGVTTAVAKNVGFGLTDIFKGDIGKGFYTMSPKAIRDIVKGVEMMATGKYRDGRGKITADVEPVDAILKGIGFHPSRVSKVQRSQRSQQQLIGLHSIVKQAIADKFARGVAFKDKAERDEAIEDLKKWNKQNPDYPIALSSQAINQRVMQLLLPSELRLLKRTPPEIRNKIYKSMR